MLSVEISKETTTHRGEHVRTFHVTRAGKLLLEDKNDFSVAVYEITTTTCLTAAETLALERVLEQENGYPQVSKIRAWAVKD